MFENKYLTKTMQIGYVCTNIYENTKELFVQILEEHKTKYHYTFKEDQWLILGYITLFFKLCLIEIPTLDRSSETIQNSNVVKQKRL